MLESLAGTWTGTNRLYFQPDVLAEESACVATVKQLGTGPAVVHEYTWHFEGEEQRGVALVTESDGVLQGSWIDTFHTSSGLMDLAPVDGAEGIVLQGTYSVPDSDDWGWRIQWSKPSATELRVTMWNVTPEGEAGIAVEQTLRS
jgi:hypothetical protein